MRLQKAKMSSDLDVLFQVNAGLTAVVGIFQAVISAVLASRIVTGAEEIFL